MLTPSRVMVLVLCAWFTCVTLAEAQSRLIGDTYTFSSTNFPTDIGETEDPVTGEVIDHGTAPVVLTIDGVAEVAGGMRVNERIYEWPGIPGGIPAVQEMGYEGQVDWDLVEWEVPGEIIEFTFETIDGDWISASAGAQSTATLRGLDWADSAAGSEPYFVETGFYFYWTVDGQPVVDYVTSQIDLGVLVGDHPFDPTIPEVGYVWFSQSELAAGTRPREGGADILIGTTLFDEDQGSWALLAWVMSLDGLAEIDGKPANAFHLGILVDPPEADETIIPGDYNRNSVLDAPDLDQQAEVALELRPFAPEYDLNGDDVVNFEDRKIWLGTLKKTWLGDSNMDLQFNTQDLVTVLSAGKYETGERAGWAEGDWSGDLKFGTSDFVAALAEGGYEQGAYPQDEAVRAVPEPHGLFLFSLAAGMLFVWRRR